MALSIRDAVSEGLSITASRNGVTLIALFLAVQTFGLIVFLAAGRTYVPVSLGTGMATGAELPTGELPRGASAVATLFVGVFNSIISTPVMIVAIRTFVGDERDGIPDAYLFGRIGRATLSGVLATFAQMVLFFGIAIVAGLLSAALFITLSGPPAIIGILLVVCAALVGFVLVWLQFLFLLHEIAVRDRGTIAAFRGSWATVRGHRVKLALLAGAIAVVRIGVSGVGAPGFDTALTASNLGITAVTVVVASVVGVTVVAIMARAYQQLRPDVDDSERSGRPATETTSSGTSA